MAGSGGVELEHFLRVILREESGPMRERLIDGLVMHALTTKNPAHRMDLATIRDRIMRLTGLPEYPIGLVESALERIALRGDLDVTTAATGTSLYRLRDGVPDPSVADGVQGVDERMERSIIRRAVLGSVSGETEVTLVVEGYRSLVAQLLATLGSQCAQCLLEKKRLDQPPGSVSQMIADQLGPLPEEIKGAVADIYLACLSSPSEAEAEYLFAVAQVYYVAALLHLDPQLQALERGRFEDTRLFLDTNVLVAAALPEDPQHRAVERLLEFSSSLGFRLVYSARSAQEWIDLISAANREYRQAPPVDKMAASLLSDLVDNVFLKTYFASYPQHRLSWDQYRIRLASPDRIMEAKGIRLETELELATSGGRFNVLKAALQAVGRKPRSAAHDATMVVSIEHAVERDEVPPHPFGSRYWLLTLDRRVVGIVRQIPAAGIGCAVMPGDEWLQYISPFVSADVSSRDVAEVFAGLFSNRVVLSLGGTLGLADLQPFTIQGVTELLDDVSQDEACRLVAAARAEAVASKPAQWDMDAIDLLSQRLAAKLEEKKARGELVPAEEVERITNYYEGAIRERDATIDGQCGELTSVRDELEQRQRVQESPTALARLLASRLFRPVSGLLRWVKQHRARASIIVGLAIVVVVQGLALGWSSTIGNYLSSLVLVCAALGLGPIWDAIAKRLK